MRRQTQRLLQGCNVAAALVIMCIALPSAQAGEPCSDLPSGEKEHYVELSMSAVKDYQDGDFASAVAKNIEARELCDDDYNVEYNISRAYHKNGDCAMALFHYKRLPLKKFDRKKRKKIKGYIKEMKGECGDTASFELTCEDDGVQVSLGGYDNLPCPFEGAIRQGSHELLASKAGFADHSQTVDVSGDVEISVPALGPEAALGTLSVTCSSGVSFFNISGPIGDDKMSCPFEGEMESGIYVLRADGRDETVEVTVLEGQLATIELDVPETTFKGSGFLVSIMLAPGIGYTAGDMYEGDELQPETNKGSISQISGAALVEVGYAFNEMWAAVVRARVDQGFGFVGYALGKMTPWHTDTMAIRIHAGAGGGYMWQPVFLDDGRIVRVQSGPFLALVGAGFALSLTDLIAFVVSTDFNLGINNEFVTQFDLGLGIELKF